MPGSAPPVIRAGCSYQDVKPGFARKDIDLTLGDVIVQNHLESSGWVGHNIANIFADGNNQGYVAFDTGWRDVESVTGNGICEPLGLPSGCNPMGFFHGHFPPPVDATVSGSINKDGHFCVGGEPKCLPDELEEAFPLGFGGKVDAVSLGFGTGFGASHRVFEFDPDELIFAEHHSGHVCARRTSTSEAVRPTSATTSATARSAPAGVARRRLSAAAGRGGRRRARGSGSRSRGRALAAGTTRMLARI